MELRKKKLFKRRLIIISILIIILILCMTVSYFLWAYTIVEKYAELRFNFSYHDDLEKKYIERSKLFEQGFTEKLNQENNLSETKDTIAQMKINSTLNNIEIDGFNIGINKYIIDADIKYNLYSETLNETQTYSCMLKITIGLNKKLEMKIYKIDLVSNVVNLDDEHEHEHEN